MHGRIEEPPPSLRLFFPDTCRAHLHRGPVQLAEKKRCINPPLAHGGIELLHVLAEMRDCGSDIVTGRFRLVLCGYLLKDCGLVVADVASDDTQMVLEKPVEASCAFPAGKRPNRFLRLFNQRLDPIPVGRREPSCTVELGDEQEHFPARFAHLRASARHDVCEVVPLLLVDANLLFQQAEFKVRPPCIAIVR